VCSTKAISSLRLVLDAKRTNRGLVSVNFPFYTPAAAYAHRGGGRRTAVELGGLSIEASFRLLVRELGVRVGVCLLAVGSCLLQGLLVRDLWVRLLELCELRLHEGLLELRRLLQMAHLFFRRKKIHLRRRD